MRSKTRASPEARRQLVYYWSLSLQLRSQVALPQAGQEGVDAVEIPSTDMVSLLMNTQSKG
jgi:hypothetical protein